jgi:hypothetical protein
VVTIFSNLSRIRTFEKTHLPFLATLEDFDIARVIGLYQENGDVLVLKQLMLEVPGSIATLTRRLSKLRIGGYVVAESHGMDRRVTSLLLSPSVNKIYVRYGALLASL